jgi:hypothetical protein
MGNSTRSPEEPPRRRGFAAHPVKAIALILGVLALLLFIGFWLISYVNLMSFEWDNGRAIKVIALGQGQLSFSSWSIPSFPSFPALAHVEDFHSGHTGNGKYPEIDVGGEYREPRNAVRSLGGSWFYWHHGAQSGWIVLVPCWVPVAITSVGLLWVGVRQLFRRWRQHKPGTCRKCGYDLRASSERCPECGTKIAAPHPPRRFAIWPRIAATVTALILAAGIAATLVYEHSFLPEPAPSAFGNPHDPIYNPEYQKKASKISVIAETIATSQPSAADIAELFEEAAHDPYWAIRTRAITVLPKLRDRERVIDVLIGCVRERGPVATGDGCVQLYAATSLANLKAYRAIPDIQGWLDFLEKYHSYDKALMPDLISGARRDLTRLRAASTQAASRPADR